MDNAMPLNTALALPRIAVLLLVVSLAGCSFTRLGYQNADKFINWKMRDYVSLTRDQKRWLGEELRTHLAWHCTSELPRYRTHLEQLRDRAVKPSLNPDDISALIPVWEAEAGRTLERLVPTMTGLVEQLDERQVAGIQQNLARQNQQMRDRYQAPARAQQNRERSKRTQDRMETWLGRLTPAQKARIDQWSNQLDGHNDVWLDNREHWQERLVELLMSRAEVQLEEQIRGLLMEPEAHWTEAFQKQRSEGTRLFAEMLSDVLALAEPRQREHLARRTDSLLQDLDNIRCAAIG
jgi:hypothetical protein